MASAEDRKREAQQAQDTANHHRRRAGELYMAHRQNGDDHTLSQAKQEAEHADSWQRKAEALQTSREWDPDSAKQKKSDAPAKTQKAPAAKRKEPERGEAEEAESSSWSSRRAWYLPGSVADDKILQAEEAQQSGLLDQLGKYAARNTFDKQFRTFENPKHAAKAVARGGRAVMDAVRQHPKSKDGGPSKQGSVMAQLQKPAKQQAEQTQKSREARARSTERSKGKTRGTTPRR